MPRVAIDISQFDDQSLNSGQYRYGVDLLRQFAVDAGGMTLLVLGSRPEPMPELAEAFGRRDPQFGYHHLPLARGRASYYRDLWRKARWLRRHRVDLFHQMHTHLPPVKPCPYVATHYDCSAHRVGDRGLLDSRPHRYYQWALRRLVDRVISISDASKDDAVHFLGLDPKRITTVHLALSPSFVFEPAGAVRPGGAPFILSPYNLEPRKNLAGLVRALPALLAVRPDVQLWLYGSSRVFGDREAAFDAEVRALGVEPKIRRLGFVPDEELRVLYATAAVFAFPTLIEGFGYPLLEAMACGACCVTTGESAMREVGGDAVQFADTRDPERFARTLLELLADDRRRDALARAARARAATFTVERMAAQTLDCYRAVLSTRGG